MRGERACGRATAATAMCRAALLGVILVLIVIAYFPFAWSPPRTVGNQVTRDQDGSLRFGAMNYARTSATPAWLQQVRTSDAIQIQLQAAPQSLQQNALVMVLASDHWHTDFAIGQYHSNLEVWLRRPGTDTEGVPGFAVGGVFRPQRWTSVAVTLQHGDLRIAVGGRTRLTGRLPAGSARMWGPGQLALGDEVHGGNPWHGQIRLAEVRTPGHAVDYVRPGALAIPQRYLYLPDHIRPFPPTTRKQWLAAFLNMLSFIPLGFLIVLSGRRPVRLAHAILLAAAFAVVLGAGKFLFDARHTSVVNIVMQAAGGLLGALLASRLAHAKNRTAWLRGLRAQATYPGWRCSAVGQSDRSSWSLRRATARPGPAPPFPVPASRSTPPTVTRRTNTAPTPRAGPMTCR